MKVAFSLTQLLSLFEQREDQMVVLGAARIQRVFVIATFGEKARVARVRVVQHEVLSPGILSSSNRTR
jgi:hypothetical protein